MPELLEVRVELKSDCLRPPGERESLIKLMVKQRLCDQGAIIFQFRRQCCDISGVRDELVAVKTMQQLLLHGGVDLIHVMGVLTFFVTEVGVQFLHFGGVIVAERWLEVAIKLAFL